MSDYWLNLFWQPVQQATLQWTPENKGKLCRWRRLKWISSQIMINTAAAVAGYHVYRNNHFNREKFPTLVLNTVRYLACKFLWFVHVVERSVLGPIYRRHCKHLETPCQLEFISLDKANNQFLKRTTEGSDSWPPIEMTL